MLLSIVAHIANFNQPTNSQGVYLSEIAHEKTSAMRNVHTCVQAVLLLQPRKLEVAFATL